MDNCSIGRPVRLIHFAASVGIVVIAAAGTVKVLGSGTLAGLAERFAVRCLSAPASAYDAVAHASPALVALLGSAACLGSIRTVSKMRAVTADLRDQTAKARLHRLPDGVAHIAGVLGIAERLDVVAAPQPFGFVHGWFRPRICVSTGLVERLDRAELEAVLLHERWHVVRRDPARLVVVKSLLAPLWFAPPFRRLVRDYKVAMEIAADRHAVAEMGESRWLASALAKAIDGPNLESAFAGHVEARIAALAGEPQAVAARSRAITAALLVLIVMALSPIVAGSGVPLVVGAHPSC